MTRTFIALAVDEAQRRVLTEIIRQGTRAVPSAHWVDPVSLHLTLAFLGELDDERLRDAMQAAQDAAHRAAVFPYRLSPLGFFGPARQPRVVWVGIEEPTGALQRLHSALQQALRQREFPIEDRPFSPHLTLARVKKPLVPQEREQLANLQKRPVPAASCIVRELNVMKSELSRSGARYTCLASYPLH